MSTELAIEIAKIVQRYENNMKNIILKDCKSILTFLAVGLIILLVTSCEEKGFIKKKESTKIESTDKSKLTSPKIQNRILKSRKLQR
jgi:hypothetical protein